MIQVDLSSFDQNTLSFLLFLSFFFFSMTRKDLIIEVVIFPHLSRTFYTSTQDSTIGEFLKSFIILLISFCMIQPFSWEICLFVDWVFYSPKIICVRHIVSNQRFVNDKLLYGKPCKCWNTDIRSSPYGPYNSFYAHADANEYRGMTVQRISQNQPKQSLRAFPVSRQPSLKHHHYPVFTGNPMVSTRREFFYGILTAYFNCEYFPIYTRQLLRFIPPRDFAFWTRFLLGQLWLYVRSLHTYIYTYFINVTNT